MDRTAGIIVIGNEILSGKVTDTNSPFLCRELRALGVEVGRLIVIPDVAEEIESTVREFAEDFDFVFTSGGVGPTHDDVTIEGVARAFRRAVVRHPKLEGRLREFYGEHANEAQLKMAEVPDGTELIFGGAIAFPTIVVKNVYVLPGIPEILEAKFQSIRDRFAGDPFYLRVVYTTAGEGTIAEYLHATLDAFPALRLGSYPKIGHPEYAVKLTLESKDSGYVDRALRHLVGALPEGSVVRTERG